MQVLDRVRVDAGDTVHTELKGTVTQVNDTQDGHQCVTVRTDGGRVLALDAGDVLAVICRGMV
jgi:hypothetical protein